MLLVLPPTFKPANNLICCKTGLIWLVKGATSLFNSFCSMRLHVFCCQSLGTFSLTKSPSQYGSCLTICKFTSLTRTAQILGKGPSKASVSQELLEASPWSSLQDSNVESCSREVMQEMRGDWGEITQSLPQIARVLFALGLFYSRHVPTI